MDKIRVKKIKSKKDLIDASYILNEVYFKEKNWLRTPLAPEAETQFKEINLSWFIARCGKRPAGLLRLVYDPDLNFPENIGLQLNEGVDLAKIKNECRLVEIGRFCVLPEFRTNFLVAIRLMKIAIREVIKRGYTHLITDVFENEPSSPYKFHTRLLGFEVIGKHLYGELNCSCTRIILILDILKTYQKMQERKNKIYSSLTQGIRRLLNERLKILPAGNQG